MKKLVFIYVVALVLGSSAYPAGAQLHDGYDSFASLEGVGLIDIDISNGLKSTPVYLYAEGDDVILTLSVEISGENRYSVTYSGDDLNPLLLDMGYITAEGYVMPKLLLRVLSADGKRYEVVFDEDTGRRGYLEKSGVATFMTWDEYLEGASMFTLRYPDEKYEVRNGPGEQYPVVRYAQGSAYERPQRVAGDWVMFRFTKCEGEQWLRWRNGGDNLLNILPQRAVVTPRSAE